MKTNTKQGDRNSGNTKQRHQHRHEKGTQRNNGGTVSMKNRNKNPRTQNSTSCISSSTPNYCYHYFN